MEGLLLLGEQPGVWAGLAALCFSWAALCVSRSLSPWNGSAIFRGDLFLLGVLSFLLPSCPSDPEGRDNHRVAVSGGGQQAAFVTRRQLWQGTAPPQIHSRGSVSPEALLALGQMAVRRRQAGQAVVAWMCPHSMTATTGALTQALPTSSGRSADVGPRQPALGHWEFPFYLLACRVASAGSGTGLYSRVRD